jgi:hypothetical protein
MLPEDCSQEHCPHPFSQVFVALCPVADLQALSGTSQGKTNKQNLLVMTNILKYLW